MHRSKNTANVYHLEQRSRAHVEPYVQGQKVQIVLDWPFNVDITRHSAGQSRVSSTTEVLLPGTEVTVAYARQEQMLCGPRWLYDVSFTKTNSYQVPDRAIARVAHTKLLERQQSYRRSVTGDQIPFQQLVIGSELYRPRSTLVLKQQHQNWPAGTEVFVHEIYQSKINPMSSASAQTVAYNVSRLVPMTEVKHYTACRLSDRELAPLRL
ncbi:hypothetical protein NLJ89_g11744 [Agrocybe chaxingu]|uniref:Uncharacterized protein n=1 Tax=Agrocybe chaxingu TaxID=84603 RepID=A0A9W8JVS0_9AGAR|nr:hypothetical protein NLJ89_g11744 [Agrocybe chaxingu]